MEQARSAGADATVLLLSRRGLGALLLLGTMMILLAALAPRSWATPAQNPLRGTVPAPGSIGGTVYLDHNRNQVEDVNERGIAGVQLTLITGGTTSLITHTNSLGNYQFPALVPGKLYTVTETTPPGYSSTTADLVEVTLPITGTPPTGEVVDFGDYKATIPLPIVLKD